MTTRRWALAAVAAVVVLSQHACADDSAPPAGALPSGESAAPAVSTEPSPAPSPVTPSEAAPSGAAPGGGTAADPLNGKRQLTFVPVVEGKERAGSVLSVTPAGRADVTDRDGDTALFVPVQVRPGRYQLKTGKLVKAGEPYCLQVKGNGSNPLTVVTAACDASKVVQQFRFQKRGDAYMVSSDGVYLQWRPKAKFGLIAEEPGEGDVTAWRVTDKGPATLPKGD
ncbi:hypothetical protein AB0M20_17375 [Actinoplanes sp. NPDC051633]|uniref:hypothetical protein n=1 Tax=Actinoplanes sp. NPDC051633 TaxID=3155670 RepID=UPI003420C380